MHDGEDWIYPEFIDAGETRTIDIEQAPVEQPLDMPPGSQEVPPDASPFDERPAIEALPPISPPPAPPPAAPPPNPPAQNTLW